jgi:hypothetical protein
MTSLKKIPSLLSLALTCRPRKKKAKNTRKAIPNFGENECTVAHKHLIEDTRVCVTVRATYGRAVERAQFPLYQIYFPTIKSSLAWWLKVTRSRKNGVNSRKPKFDHERTSHDFSRIVSHFLYCLSFLFLCSRACIVHNESWVVTRPWLLVEEEENEKEDRLGLVV